MLGSIQALKFIFSKTVKCTINDKCKVGVSFQAKLIDSTPKVRGVLHHSFNSLLKSIPEFNVSYTFSIFLAQLLQ